MICMVDKGSTQQAPPLRLFPPAKKATFVERPNRFLVRCRLARSTVEAFLPNPGRLGELLLPGARLHIVKEPGRPTRKTEWTVVAVEREGVPVVLHTHKTNDAAQYLIEQGLVPGLEGAAVKAREVKVGRSRFDFLLRLEGADVLLEVKSCTLAGEQVAMFPDAVTERGARHVIELARLAEEGTRTAVLFVVHWPRATAFMPDHHTDLHFAKALLSARKGVRIIAVAASWTPDLALTAEARSLEIPWELIERESHDKGSYLLVLHLARPMSITVGQLGRLRFPKGYYIYVGSAMQGLTKRIERHRRLRKKMHWHIDWLRSHARVVDALPIRASERLECTLADAVSAEAQWSIPGFGCSDCACASHLFGSVEDPRIGVEFQRLLAWFRMDRLRKKVAP